MRDPNYNYWVHGPVQCNTIKQFYWSNFYWWQQKETITKWRLTKFTHTSTAGALPLNLEENPWRVSPSQRRNPHTFQDGTWSRFSTLGCWARLVLPNPHQTQLMMPLSSSHWHCPSSWSTFQGNHPAPINTQLTRGLILRTNPASSSSSQTEICSFPWKIPSVWPNPPHLSAGRFIPAKSGHFHWT